MKRIKLIALAVLLSVTAAYGENLTKGEAIMQLSATGFMKQKIGELLSWAVGYDVSKVNRVKLTPTINWVKAVPRRLPPDGRTILELTASVDDPGGLGNIAGVRADLSAIGRLPNMMLVDNGLFGDAVAGDGIYTLQATIPRSVALGGKDIPVAVANKKGWLALAKTSIEIKKSPIISAVSFTPERGLADGRTSIKITAMVDNPGRLEDVESVTADLRAVGLSDREPLSRLAGSDVWALQFLLSANLAAGTFVVPVQATNTIGGLGAAEGTLTVYK